jgi:hypothetical protein
MVETNTWQGLMKNSNDRWCTTPSFWEKLKPKRVKCGGNPQRQKDGFGVFYEMENISSDVSTVWDNSSLTSIVKIPTLL